MANKLVEYLPDWIAPNLITFIGFLHAVVPVFLAFAFGGFDLIGTVPSWILFVEVYCFFVYRLLDEMDGKQARRTGNSSPLGLLFDHGCDCFATGLQLLLGMKVGQIGNNGITQTFMIVGLLAFHFSTLEEYYVGTLKLPVCNAVSDGSGIVIAFFLFTGIVGN